MRISDLSSDVCSSDLPACQEQVVRTKQGGKAIPPFRFHIEKSGNGGFRPEDKARRLGRRARQAGKFSEIVLLLGGGMLVLLADVRLNDADAGGSALRDGRAGESCNAHEQREDERQDRKSTRLNSSH